MEEIKIPISPQKPSTVPESFVGTADNRHFRDLAGDGQGLFSTDAILPDTGVQDPRNRFLLTVARYIPPSGRWGAACRNYRNDSHVAHR